MEDVNFNEVCLNAMNMEFKEGQEMVWRETFKLNDWYILFDPKTQNSPKPIVAEINNRAWIFVFTDEYKAKKFAKRNSILDENGTAFIIKMEPDVCVPWLRKYGELGIFGVRFNEGKLGWYVSMVNIEYIYNYLKENIEGEGF